MKRISLAHGIESLQSWLTCNTLMATLMDAILPSTRLKPAGTKPHSHSGGNMQLGGSSSQQHQASRMAAHWSRIAVLGHLAVRVYGNISSCRAVKDVKATIIHRR
jgi:hypothetical protein